MRKQFKTCVTTLPVVFLIALSVALTLFETGCGSDDESTAASVDQGQSGGNATPPIPSALNFKKIEQESQSQNQQTGRLCPGKFKVTVQQSGEVDIKDHEGQHVVTGRMTDAQTAEVFTAANDSVQQGVDQTTKCDEDEDSGYGDESDDGYSTQSSGMEQVFITNNEDQTDLVAAAKDGKTCDFTKGGAGKQLQQQMGKVVQQACDGKLPPKPPHPTEPSPTPRPRPSTSPAPSPTPSTSPTPSPTPSTSPTPSSTPASPESETESEPTAATTPSLGAEAIDDCKPAYDALLAGFDTAKQCAVDSDCNYLTLDLVLIARTDATERVTEFSCGDGLPRLVTANGSYVSANRDKLASDLNAVIANCDLDSVISGCTARADFPSNPPPSCSAGKCVNGS